MILFVRRKNEINKIGDIIEAIIDPVVVGCTLIPHKLSKKEIEEMNAKDIKDKRLEYIFIANISLQGKDGNIHEYDIGYRGLDIHDEKSFDDAVFYLKANIDAANSVISENRNITLKEFIDKIYKYLMHNYDTKMN